MLHEKLFFSWIDRYINGLTKIGGGSDLFKKFMSGVQAKKMVPILACHHSSLFRRLVESLNLSMIKALMQRNSFCRHGEL